jgi:predicted PurR-regulated permease PerM
LTSGFTLWALRHILTPLALAVFLLLMIDGLARALQHRIRGFPAWAALPAAVAIIVGVLALAIWFAADNGADFAGRAPEYQARLNGLIGQGAARLGLHTSPTLQELVKQANPARFAGVAAEGLRNVGEGAVFVLIYLGFLLASRRGFERKSAALFESEAKRNEARRVFERIRKGVESYVWVQTVVGVVIAGVSAALMWAVGLEHVLFWAFIIFLANYIPAIGAAIGVLFPPLFGLVQFDDLWRPLLLLGGLEAVHFAVSHVLQPRMQGRSLNVDPLVVLFALTFWGALWGVTGAFLSTPLTVAAMAILSEFRATRSLAVLLSGDGRPYADLEAQAESGPIP